ncbi:MAG: hypothetical protein GPJ54_15355 [Candidatus Heimdallarchaeota archaeon]|nr:hypothetical protein [Candidatus Heimdallarchaeota archaeon]
MRRLAFFIFLILILNSLSNTVAQTNSGPSDPTIISSFGGRSHYPTTFRYPSDLGIMDDKLFVVSDRDILIYDFEGSLLNSFSIPGGDPNIAYTSHILVTEYRIYIVDINEDVLRVYNHQGHFLFNIDTNLEYPRDVAVTDTNIYILDNTLSQIISTDTNGKNLNQISFTNYPVTLPTFTDFAFYNDSFYISFSDEIGIFNLSGEFQSRFGTKGNGTGEFDGINSISIANNEIFVGESVNNRIQVLDMDGVHQRFIDEQGFSNGQFSRLFRVNAYGDKLAIVDDDRVQVLSTSGEFITGLGLYDGEFAGIGKIAQNETHYFIEDVYAHRLQILTKDGDYVASINDVNIADITVNSEYIMISDYNTDSIRLYDHHLNFVRSFGDTYRGITSNETHIAVVSGFNVHIFDTEGTQVHSFAGAHATNISLGAISGSVTIEMNSTHLILGSGASYTTNSSPRSGVLLYTHSGEFIKSYTYYNGSADLEFLYISDLAVGENGIIVNQNQGPDIIEIDNSGSVVGVDIDGITGVSGMLFEENYYFLASNSYLYTVHRDGSIEVETTDPSTTSPDGITSPLPNDTSTSSPASYQTYPLSLGLLTLFVCKSRKKKKI